MMRRTTPETPLPHDRAPARHLRTLTIGALVVVATSACMLDTEPTVPETRAESPGDPASTSSEPPSADTPSPSAAPSTSPPDRQREGATPGAADPCDDVDRDEMRGAVLAQLQAIRARDWAEALTFTTSRFRSEVDEQSFEEIIVDGFPVVAQSVAADTTLCVVTDDGLASMAVTVEDADGGQQDLVYLFEREQGTWRIGGAVLGGDDGGTDGGFTV